MSPARAHALALLLLATAGCVAGNKLQRWESPGGSVPTLDVEDVPVTGAHIDVDAEGQTTKGELLAVDAMHFWVLPEQSTTWTPVHRATVTAVHVRLYDTYPGVNAGLMVAGIATTLANGYFLLVTAPVWVILGSVSIVSAAAARYYPVDSADYNLLPQFARFPEGMPPGKAECVLHAHPEPVPPASPLPSK